MVKKNKATMSSGDVKISAGGRGESKVTMTKVSMADQLKLMYRRGK